MDTWWVDGQMDVNSAWCMDRWMVDWWMVDG